MHAHARKSSKSFAHGNVPGEGRSGLSFGDEGFVRHLCLGSDSAVRRLDGLIEEKWLADVFYLWDGALEIKGF